MWCLCYSTIYQPWPKIRPLGACHHTKLYGVIFCLDWSPSTRPESVWACWEFIIVDGLVYWIYNYMILQYLCLIFFFKEWVVPVIMQRCRCSCSLLRNENAEDFRHSWLETYNHGMLELERRGGGEEIFQLLSIDSIFECTERNLVIYPLESSIWSDGCTVFSWYFVTIKVTSARIWTGLMNFFLHEYAAFVYEGT